VLNATLDYSALSAGRVTLHEAEFHLADSVRSAVLEYQRPAEAKNLRLYSTLAEGLPETVIGDEFRIRQILSHLLGNAIKFTAAGEIELRVSAAPLSPQTTELSIIVRDTGIGIAEDRLGQIFESFRQLEGGLSRSYAGLGLGLALVDRLATLMRGRVTVESEVGKGSTFTVRLPVGLPEALAAGDPIQPGETKRVLLVEDNEVSQRVAAHVLRNGGYHLDIAASGQQALEAAARIQYDLILMDLQMPGMDGIETTGYIRRLPGYESVPILALTANSPEDLQEACRRSGMRAFLTKPIQANDLLATVGRFLART
jgi:CheY-like chemotaxis protein/anti-sigma regulatory factor (Ser/Thr protein kinase)